MLTAAINTACARQFDRIQQFWVESESGSQHSVGQNGVLNLESAATLHRQAPPVPVLSSGTSVEFQVEPERKKKKKKARFDERATNSDQSLQSVSNLPDMDENGIIQ